jgi:light-regulated signal transduction histidine kinase (bacteriophytochrome)
LREIGEEIVKNQFNPIKDQSNNVDEVIYELRVHQIEVEMQNEELRKVLIKLEDFQCKYFDLYSFAPLGYFTLDKEGIILRSEKILETVLINLKPLIKNNNAIITHDPLPLIYANDQQMIQLFQNLIGKCYHIPWQRNS